jgi:hypothetical protein
MQTVEQGTTGTRHIVKETVVEDENGGNHKTECGRWAYGEAEHSPMLEEFPEDFGNLEIDCEQCANTVEL